MPFFYYYHHHQPPFGSNEGGLNYISQLYWQLLPLPKL